MRYHSKLFRLLACLVAVFLTPGVQPAFADVVLVSEFQQQALAGEADAQYKLAESYYRGEGVIRNYSQALSWYRKAAEQGHVEAQYQMGYLYKLGLSNLEKDDIKSFEWFHKAAMQGHTSSQTKVSIMYSQGTGVEKDQVLSRQWAEKVLLKKGLIDNSEKSSTTTEMIKRPHESSAGLDKAPEKKISVKTKQEPDENIPGDLNKYNQSGVGVSAVSPAPVEAVITSEQQKAWRYEQARRLVEEANKNATIGWSEEP